MLQTLLNFFKRKSASDSDNVAELHPLVSQESDKSNKDPQQEFRGGDGEFGGAGADDDWSDSDVDIAD